MLRLPLLTTISARSQQIIDIYNRCISTGQFRNVLKSLGSEESTSKNEITQAPLSLVREHLGHEMSARYETPNENFKLTTACSKVTENQQHFNKEESFPGSSAIDGTEKERCNVFSPTQSSEISLKVKKTAKDKFDKGECGCQKKINHDDFHRKISGCSSGGSSKPCSKTKMQTNFRMDSNLFNCCVKITGPRQVQIRECPMPELQDDHVMIKMHSTGLCGSDSYLFTKGIGKVEENDVSLGHEGAGVVVKVGNAITHLKKGDRVAIESGVPCCQCRFCKCGRYNLCEKIKYTGLLSAFLTHPGRFCYKVPQSMDLELAALTDTLAQALQSCRKANIGAGSNLLILGACSRGLATIIAARSMGADTITIVDTEDKNLRIARKICVDNAVYINHSMSTNEIVEKVLADLQCRPNAVIDCCGCTNTVNIAVHAVEQGGHCVLSGCQTECANMPILSALAKQICYTTSFGSAFMFPRAVNLINKNRVLVNKIITHRLEFSDSQRAFEFAAYYDESGAIKVLIKWSHEIQEKNGDC